MLQKRIASVLALVGMFAVVALLSSCDKSDDSQVVPSQVKSETRSGSVSDLKYSEGEMVPTAVEPWGSFSYLRSTGNNEEYFAKGLYAARVYVGWYQSSVSVYLKASQSAQGSGRAYCSIKKYDGNHRLMESYGPALLDESNSYPFSEVTARGDEYIIVLLHVIDPGYYRCWF